MIVKVSDNILSPLGFSTQECFRRLSSGESLLCRHEFGCGEPFMGSLIDRVRAKALLDSLGLHGESFFDSMCIASATLALKESGIDPSSPETVFVLSTTKGNVSCLERDLFSPEAYIYTSAEKLRGHFSNPNPPVVVSNACISGVCAQIAAVRLLQSGRYRHAVVVGGDELSRFIVSGFQSFKALDPELCRPYDVTREGLNLGEAFGTLVLSDETQGEWIFASSSIHNDANHISGPSRTGEGLYRVLEDLLQSIDPQDLAFVNAHGTATRYNDEMESIALHRTGLDAVPVCALKGFLGHTLGAAGIIETILSMKFLEEGKVPPTKGYAQCGTTYPLNLSPKIRPSQGSCFIKVLSGFGGSNAGLAYTRAGAPSSGVKPSGQILKQVTLSPRGIFVDGKELYEVSSLSELYHSIAPDYPKFFKMDGLCKVGFLAAELLLRGLSAKEKDSIGICLCGRSGSMANDRKYQGTISDSENYYPSPALFVYTLANIVTGEIAIRHGIHGESSFYILDNEGFNHLDELTVGIQEPLVLSGRVDFEGENDYIADLKLIKH